MLYQLEITCCRGFGSAELNICCSKMRLCKYNMIDEGRRGRKPGYIHEMGSYDLKSCEVRCQHNTVDIIRPYAYKKYQLL